MSQPASFGGNAAFVYGPFTLGGVAYLVTSSAGPHTVNVYEHQTSLMVCTVRDPRGEREPAWGRQWVTAAEAWKTDLLDQVTVVVGAWFDQLDHGLSARRPFDPPAGSR